jgi:hypothetical protein
LAASRTGLHQNVGTWAAIIGIGAALAGVIFSAGDAKQMQLADHVRLDTVERQMQDSRMSLEVLKAQMNDVREVVHRLDGTPVPTLYGSAPPASRPRP